MSAQLDLLPWLVLFTPNLGELVTRASLDDIISQLKEHYDYVILITAPVGLVNDSLQLGRLANLCVYVCRADYTPKASFGMINGLKPRINYLTCA